MLKMTSKERLQAGLNGAPSDRVPYSPNLAYFFDQLPEKYRSLGHLNFCKLIDADLLNRFGPCPVKAILPEKLIVKNYESSDRIITEHVTPVGVLRKVVAKSKEGHTSFLIEHPLKSKEDYKIQIWIEENTKFESDSEPVKNCFAENPDALHLGMLIPERMKSAFQFMVEHLAGTEELIYNLYDFPEIVNELWTVMVSNNLAAVRIAALSEYEYFITWEDSSTQNYSPVFYQQYIASEISRWVDVLASNNKKYIQHACGHVKDLLPIMKSTKIHSIESIAPAPTGNVMLKDARQCLGDKIGIIGGIEPTELLNRSVEKLEHYVEQIIADCQGGPFILANSDSCPPGVTIEKLAFISQIAKRHKV